jgi:cysteine desulfurase
MPQAGGGLHAQWRLSQSREHASLRPPDTTTTIFIDGAQGFTKEPLDFRSVHMYAFSAHKFGGRVGVGGLMIRGGTRILPLMHGGGQERGLRPGTVDVAGICEMAHTAAQMHAQMQANHDKTRTIRDIIASVSQVLDGVEINTLSPNVSPYILNMSFAGVRGEVLVHQLDSLGVLASTGAACHSKGKSIPALLAMGFPRERAESAIRFSFSPAITPEAAHRAREIIIQSVTHLRRIV